LTAQEEQDSVKYPPGSYEIVESLNFKNTDFRDIIRALALQYKTNIVIDNSINKRVSVALHKLTLRDAIQIIAEDNGYEFSFDSNRFFVKTKEPPKPAPPPPPPKAPDPIITYYEETDKLDIVLDNAEIKAVINKLRKETGKNFLITRGTSGKLTGSLNEIDLRTGLKNILQNNGFYLIEKDSIYYVSRSSYFSSLEDPNKKTKGLYWVGVQNGKVTIDVKNTDLGKVLDDIANQLDLQLIKLEIPTAKVTVKCSEVDLDKALYYLFKGTEYTFKKENEAYIIGGIKGKGLENTKLVKLDHLRADKIMEKLPGKLFPSVIVQNIIEHNALLLSGLNDEVVGMEEYLKTIDQPVPQVMIEALVVDYNLDNLFKFGLNAGSGDSSKVMRSDKWFPGLDVTVGGKKINKLLDDIGNINVFGKDINLSAVKLPEDFYANVQFLESNGIANVKSRPLLSTLNGHTASLKIGETQNYVFTDILPVNSVTGTSYIEQEKIEKIEANISFEITPWVGSNKQLTLEIKPDFQTPKGEFSSDKKLIPSINTRTFESTVKLKDGETIILGGLVQDTKTYSESKFPLLGDIPILGEFFKTKYDQKEKSELIIYLTPRIFYEDEFGYAHYEYAEEE
jgi:type IV pilus assembly protein PilQ